MKKHRRVRRRPKHHTHAPKRASSAGRDSGTGQSWIWIGWVGGIGLIALIGFLVFQKHSPANDSTGAGIAESTNKTGSGITTRSGDAGGVGTIPGGTNRPGAAVNREKEGHADDLNDQGTRFLEAGDAKQAAEMFAKAVKLAPENETLHFNLGVALNRAGDVTNAEFQYKEALRLVPDYPEANNNYGNLLAREGRLAEAKEHLAAAVDDTPDSAPYNNSLGVVRERLNETNEALLCFKKAVECDSNYMEAHFNLAQSYITRKDRAKAIEELRETLRIKPGFEPAMRALTALARAVGE